MSWSHGVYAAAALWVFADCVPPRPAKSIEQRYLDDLIHCIDSASTRAEADVCRREVDKRYGVGDGVK